MGLGSKLVDAFSSDIGIDLGTCNTLIYVRGKGIVISEPSVVAVERGHVLACLGLGLAGPLGRLTGGVIADLETTEKMIRYFISKVLPRRWFVKPRMVIGVPSCITEVERRAVHGERNERGHDPGGRERQRNVAPRPAEEVDVRFLLDDP